MAESDGLVTLATTLAALALGGGAGVTVTPQNAARDGMVRISVHGVAAQTVDARLEGGVASGGRWFSWVRLLPAGPGSWYSILRAPGYLGVFPVQLRAGGRVVATTASVRILPPGFARRPGFWQPESVARWWVGTRHVRLESVSTWRSGYFTHRDPMLNRLLRVGYAPSGRDPAVVYLSIARLTLDTPWRLLQAVGAP